MPDQPDRKKDRKTSGEKIWKRSLRTQTLADAALPIIKPVLGKQGLNAIEVVTSWPLIVGERIARYSIPLKLTRPRFEGHEGTLHIQVASGGFALELQHQEPQILERINGYFGYRAVGKLRFIQAPLPKRPDQADRAQPETQAPLAPEQQAMLETTLDGIQNPALRAALSGLGERVLRKNKIK